MATRMHAREAVLELLYALDLGNTSSILHARCYFESKKIKNKQQEFAVSLLEGVNDHIANIDSILQLYIKGWELDRLGGVERSILRIATYEIMYTCLDRAVIINEALELSKMYGVDGAVRFINGVLDSVARSVANDPSKNI